MRALEPRLPGDAVDGVDLDATRIDELAEHTHHVETLDFFVVAAGGRKEQHGRPEVTPSNDARRFRQALRIPVPVLFPHLLPAGSKSESGMSGRVFVTLSRHELDLI